MHICTSEDFMVDAISFTGFCPVCCKKNQPIRVGWIECHCGGCNNYFSPESANRTVKQRRELLGLSRKEIAEKMGLKSITIRQYENDYPSNKYWQETRKMMETKNG